MNRLNVKNIENTELTIHIDNVCSQELGLLLGSVNKLSVKKQKLLGLGIVLFLALSLPLLVWAVLTQRLDLRKRASTGEPPIANPVSWIAGDVSITADDFYFVSNGKTYFGNAQDVTIIPGIIDNNPNPVKWSNIEIRTNQHGDDVRMKIYFAQEGSTWYIHEIGILNSNYSDSWVTYKGPLIYTVLGHTYRHNGTRQFNLIDYTTGNVVAEVSYTNLRVRAFTQATPPPTADYVSAGDVSWVTPYAFFQATNFYLLVNGKYYFAQDATFVATANSNYPDDVVLTSTWQEYGHEMKMEITYTKNDYSWFISKIRTSDGITQNGWIEYPLFFVGNGLSLSYHQSSPGQLTFIDPDTGSVSAIFFRSLNAGAFGATPLPTPLVQVCGGIAGIVCPNPQICVYENGSTIAPYPDAQGVCQPKPSNECGLCGVNGYECATGLICTQEQCPTGLHGSFCNILPGICVMPNTTSNCPAFPTSSPQPSLTPSPIASECEICGIPEHVLCDVGLTCYQPELVYPAPPGICIKIDGTSNCNTAPSPTATPFVSGDVDGDGVVNVIDLGIIIDNYRLDPILDLRADLNGDGIVNIVDVGMLVDNYGYGETI